MTNWPPVLPTGQLSRRDQWQPDYELRCGDRERSAGQPLGAEEIADVAFRITIHPGKIGKRALSPVPQKYHSLQADEPDRHHQQNVQRPSDTAIEHVEYRSHHHSIDGRVQSLDEGKHGAPMLSSG